MWIANENFLEKEIPKLHPMSLEYKEYWREQKRRCILGYWSGGKWMPGNLYFYMNFGTIMVNKSQHSKTKVPSRPALWDIFWELSNYWAEARGLTGFSSQEGMQELVDHIDSKVYNPELEAKLRGKVGNIRTLLTETTKDLGKPLYLNEAQNLMMMGNRGYGKSFYVANAVVAHEFLFDGMKDYTEELIKSPPAAEIVVGAGDTKYSAELLKKVKLTIDSLPGGTMIGELYYPCPFYKQTTGSWQPTKEMVALYKKKLGGAWKELGSRSTIKHRTYKDNPFASNGTRPAILVKEEIGMFDNLIAAHEADIECQNNGTYKFGSTMLLGTGGDMAGGTVDASKMFYDPETYRLLVFDDIWEHKGKIGYFVPATKGLQDYKDSEGRSNMAGAEKFLHEFREQLRKGKNAATALDAEVQNRPIVPSEMFLTKGGNIFPRKELQEWLGTIENNDKYTNAEYVGELSYEDDTNKVVWKPSTDVHPITKFPVDMIKDNIEGALVIWEHPHLDEDGNVPIGLYVAGTDPYDHDESGTSSLGSTFIYKRFHTLGQWNNVPVAEYTGRPKANTYYENLRKLLVYYNARDLYENEKKGLHQYFEQKNCAYLLMDQPGYIKDIVANSKVDRVKGIHMSTPLKRHGEDLIKNWLEEEYAPGRMNLTKIRSVPLLKELISYNPKGNFDRVMGFMCTMYAVQETYKRVVEPEKKIVLVHQQDFFNRAVFRR